VRQDPVMMRIMANNPVVRQIFQQDSQPNVATEGKASTDAIGPESVQLKCADCTASDSVQVPEKELQQDTVSVREVQKAAKDEKSSESKIQQVAATGFKGSAASLPHLNRIQQAFGVDLSGVQAYVGGDAAAACQRMGAQAFASGNQIAFKEQPSLELVAHEAAHVVQQASGKVQLRGGVGKVGDEYENHADAVAAKVAAGESAVPLLAEYAKTNQTAQQEKSSETADKSAQVDAKEPSSGDNELRDSFPVKENLANVATAKETAGKSDALLPADLQAQQSTNRNQGTANTLGIVSDKQGVNLRDKPLPGNQSRVLRLLPFNTKLFVEKALPGSWYKVSLTTGEYGYVAASYVKTNLPEPGATLHSIGPRETAIGIAERYYRNDIARGQDLRYYVNVLVYANSGGGIYYKPNSGASWGDTQVQSGFLIWIPSAGFANSLKGKVRSGSITREAWDNTKKVAQTVGNFALGGGAFVAGLVQGALESLWDILVGVKDLAVMAWDVLKSLFEGEILKDAQALWDSLSKLNPQELIAAGINYLADKWNQPDFISRWRFRGWLSGYAIVELATTFFSGGITTAIKSVAKAGKLSQILAKFPKVARFVERVRNLKGPAVDKLQKAIRASPLLMARNWAATALKIPTEILQNLSVEAIARLKTLPPWAKDRFSELNHGAMRRVLGCASPCKSDPQAILSYFRNLAVREATEAEKLLSSVDDVLKALPQGINTTDLSPKLERGPMIEAIKRAQLTDLDFKKFADFIPKNATARDVKETFTAYLNAVVPSKIGPDINRFNEIAEAIVKADARQGSPLKGAMFENFVRLYVPGLENLQKAWIPIPGKQPKRLDGFIARTGEIWEIKHQFDKAVPQDQAQFYKSYVGKQIRLDPSDSTQVATVRSLNYLFPNQQAALKNKELLKSGINVFYIEPSGGTVKKVQMLR
jgi:hypothetical protein